MYSFVAPTHYWYCLYDEGIIIYEVEKIFGNVRSYPVITNYLRNAIVS